MSTDLLHAIDSLVPRAPSAGDWDDVVVRAAATPTKQIDTPPTLLRRRRALSRRRVVIAVALLVLVIALVATPAFGIQRLVLDLLGRKHVSFHASPAAANVVKKQFADLAIGEPPRFASGVEPGKAREVGRFRVRGTLHTLWVAPTSNGGYCFIWERLFGGCRRGDQRHFAFQPGTVIRQARGQQPRFLAVEGELSEAAAEHIVIVYGDRTRSEIPFVWVSKPIAAGFYAYTIPVGHQMGSARPVRMLLRDAHNHEIGNRPINSPPRLPLAPPTKPARVQSGMRQELPTQTIKPTLPLQRGSDHGVTVTAGANGSVMFDTSALDASRRALMTRGTTYSCFKLARVFGIFDVQGLGWEGRLQATVAVRMNGLHAPYDGCELSASVGHRWPDRLGSHSPIEIALTDTGRRFFTDRATARDLALFVRTKQVRQLRAQPSQQALANIQHLYARQLAHDSIHIEAAAGGLRFSKTSPTGTTFYVLVQHVRVRQHGKTVERAKITKQNLKPYALVF